MKQLKPFAAKIDQLFTKLYNLSLMEYTSFLCEFWLKLEYNKYIPIEYKLQEALNAFYDVSNSVNYGQNSKRTKRKA